MTAEYCGKIWAAGHLWQPPEWCGGLLVCQKRKFGDWRRVWAPCHACTPSAPHPFISFPLCDVSLHFNVQLDAHSRFALQLQSEPVDSADCVFHENGGHTTVPLRETGLDIHLLSWVIEGCCCCCCCLYLELFLHHVCICVAESSSQRTRWGEQISAISWQRGENKHRATQ